MQHQIQYVWKVKTAFYGYLHKGMGEDWLLNQLREAEADAGKELWFKFFEGDTGATTINDIARDLRYPGHPNFAYIRESMELAINEIDGLQIYTD